MLNNCVVTFYDNSGLIFKSLEHKALNGTKNWLRSATPPQIDASSRENCSEYPNFRESFTDPKTRVVHGADSEDFVILACAVLIKSQRVTNRRTDGFAIAKTGHLHSMPLC